MSATTFLIEYPFWMLMQNVYVINFYMRKGTPAWPSNVVSINVPIFFSTLSLYWPRNHHCAFCTCEVFSIFFLNNALKWHEAIARTSHCYNVVQLALGALITTIQCMTFWRFLLSLQGNITFYEFAEKWSIYN